MSQIVDASVEQITCEIKLLKQQTAQNIIEIGKRLTQVKETLPHGQWGEWLEREAEFTDRTAQRFMRAAREFANTTSMSGLSPTKILALLDVPADQREELMLTPQHIPSTGESKSIENMTVRELEEVKRALKESQERVYEAQLEAARLREAKQLIEEQAVFILNRDEEYRREIAELKEQKTIEKVEELIVPHDYESTKRRNQELSEENIKLERTLQRTLLEFERKIAEISEGPRKTALRDLNRLLTEQMKSIGYYHDSAIMTLRAHLVGDPQASQLVHDFIHTYSKKTQLQLEDWYQALSIDGEGTHENERDRSTVASSDSSARALLSPSR